jgi:D-fructose-responsive transcription factor
LAKTVEEIARALGVSITTVRLVTGGRADKYRISAHTQKRITDYIKEHGYRINHAARSLKLQRSEAIGLVIPEINNVFFAQIMAEFEVLCRKSGLVLLTVSTKEDIKLEHRALQILQARGVDGLIVAPSAMPAYESILDKKLRKNVVLIDRAFAETSYPVIASDNFQGGQELARAMTAACGGPIPVLCANPSLPSIVDRMRGVTQVWQQSGWPEEAKQMQLAETDDIAAGHDLASRMLAHYPSLPNGFICSSLLVLEGVLQEIKSRYGKVPPDVLIGTFDDHPMLKFLPNRVLSVRQNVAALALRTFERIEQRMRGEAGDAAVETIPVDLISHN